MFHPKCKLEPDDIGLLIGMVEGGGIPPPVMKPRLEPPLEEDLKVDIGIDEMGV